MINLRPSLLASSVLSLLLTPMLARAADISLDNVSLPTGGKSKITFKHIDLVDANLTAEEAQKLFSGEMTREAVADQLARLKAARIAITEATSSSEEPGTLVFHDFKAEGVDQGAVAHASLGGLEATAPAETGGEITAKSQQITVDGLRVQRLAEAIKAKEAATATLRIARGAWGGFDLAAPDKDTPAGADGGNLIRVHLNSATIEQTYDGDTPNKMAFIANGLSVVVPKASQAGAMLTAFGYDKIEATMKFAGAYDASRQSFSLDDYSVSLVKIGSISLSGQFGALDKSAFGGDAKAKAAAVQASQVRALKIKLENSGALEKAVALTALSKRVTPDEVKTQWSAIAAQGPLLAPNVPAVAALSQGLIKFIANGKSLTLSLTARPPAPTMSEMRDLRDPAQISARFDVAAEAEGNAPGLALPATSPALAAPAPAPGDSAKTLTGLAAWSAVVGNTITGKDSDGLSLSEFYGPDGTVKQLDDDETATGKWVVRGENVCFKFPREKEENCYKVEVIGDMVTFIDEDGDGKRYTILSGNAKKL
jgi:hypothetical protein